MANATNLVQTQLSSVLVSGLNNREPAALHAFVQKPEPGINWQEKTSDEHQLRLSEQAPYATASCVEKWLLPVSARIVFPIFVTSRIPVFELTNSLT